ncbi:MAG: hypothetical protein LBJ00_11830 [Planctomycetaceae bacterium]|jgi:hypothetical protein|nr:hypothetical protein [Planctomycetaceae bacterium]
MKSFKKAFGLLIMAAVVFTASKSTVFSQTVVVPAKASITVRSNGVAQPNVPVRCTQTGEVKYTASQSTYVNGVLTAVGEVRFENDILDRSKYFAYAGGAWHPCTDDCPTNPSITHFHCELPDDYVSLKITSYNSYPGGLANVKVCLTDFSNQYLGDPAFISANYEFPKTNAYGSVILIPPKNTAFKVWVDSNNDNNWEIVTYHDSLTSNLEYVHSADYIMPLTPADESFVDGQESITFKWIPIAGCPLYTINFWNGSGWVEWDETEGTQIIIAGASPGIYAWCIMAYQPWYDEVGNLQWERVSSSDYYIFEAY